MNELAESTDCVGRLKVLADETRLAVIASLMQSPRHVGELVDLLDVEQSLMSHHLRILRDAGLVQATRDGKAVLYRLAPSISTTPEGQAIDLGCCRLSFNQPVNVGRR